MTKKELIERVNEANSWIDDARRSIDSGLDELQRATIILNDLLAEEDEIDDSEEKEEVK